MRSVRGTATRERLGLIAILLLAFLLRWIGLGRELPYRIEPDSSLVFQMQRMEGDPALVQRDHSTGPYPLLLARIFSWLPYPEVPARATGEGNERVHLATSALPFVRIRAGVAIASALGVLLAYFLARRFLATGAALLATFLAATSLLSILFAGQARPHPVQATLALLALLLALRVRERPDAKRIALAALASFAAIATLQNGVFTLVPLAVAIVLGGRDPVEGRERSTRSALLLAGIVGLLAVGVALLAFPGTPYVDANGIHLGSDETGAHTIHPSLANFGGIPRVARMLWEFDPLLALLGSLGAILGAATLFRAPGDDAARRKRDAVIVLAYAVPYVGVLAVDPNVQERFLLPLVPFLACLAAGAIAAVRSGIRGAGSRARAIAANAVAIALAGVPAVAAACYARTAATPDTYALAANWIRANVRPEERILSTPGAVLPLLIDDACLREDLRDRSWLANPWLVYQSLLPADLPGDVRWKILVVPIRAWQGKHELDLEHAEQLIREEQADYVLLEDSVRMHKFFPTADLERAAAAAGDLVYRSVGRIPGPDDGGIFEYSGTRELARRILTTESFGPGILIYRLRR